ncbi:MAG: hypothetical protein V4722_06910 [Bacteroidota bacterium]
MAVSKRWTNFISNEPGIDLSLQGDALKAELIKELDAEKLKALQVNEGSGYDDFAGNRLIQPGFPSTWFVYLPKHSPLR